MRILLVEDDPDLSRALQSGLERQGVVADVVGSLAEAALALREPVHQLLLLDRQLPDGDGAGFVASARALRPNLAVIMLTAKGTLSDKVEGLDVGADDYLVKPVAIEELMARIRAVSRRPSAMVTPSLRLGRLEFDFESLQAQVEGQPLALPRRQVLVLQALAMRQGRTVTRSALEAAVYGFDDEIQSNALDAHISKLRKALQQAGAGGGDPRDPRRRLPAGGGLRWPVRSVRSPLAWLGACSWRRPSPYCSRWSR
nr:response regulator transcription factor [Stenotrophomonas maltophilia]